MTIEAKVVAELFEKLCASKRLPFPDRGSKLLAPNGHGDYIIYSPDGDILHVGST